MTKGEFDRAVRSRTPVRLKDRTACFYQNEWYRPIRGRGGERQMEKHNGDVEVVDAELLDKLRTQEAGTKVEDLVQALMEAEAGLRIVVPSEDGGYDDVVIPAEIETIAVESRSSRDDSGYHGPDDEAVGDADPTERVLVLRTP